VPLLLPPLTRPFAAVCQEAVDIISQNLAEGAEYACEELIQTAAARWQEEEGDYRDDVGRFVVVVAMSWLSVDEFLCVTLNYKEALLNYSRRPASHPYRSEFYDRLFICALCHFDLTHTRVID